MFGEIFSNNISKFNYLNILKNNLSFQEKSENKNLFLTAVSKEVSISKVANYQTDIKESTKKNTNQNITTSIQTESNSVSENISQEEKTENILENTLENTLETNATAETMVEKEYPVQTCVVQDNNLSENYNTIYKDVRIKNETNFNLSQSILTPDVKFTNKNIIIFHTHTCESYTRNKRESICSFWKF